MEYKEYKTETFPSHKNAVMDLIKPKQWNKMEDVRPTKDNLFLIIEKRYPKDITVLCYNVDYGSWDDGECDDNYCNNEDILYWMEFPDLPTELK